MDEFNLELHDAQHALGVLAKIHGLYDENRPKEENSWWRCFLESLPVETRKQIWVAQMNANRASTGNASAHLKPGGRQARV